MSQARFDVSTEGDELALPAIMRRSNGEAEGGPHGQGAGDIRAVGRNMSLPAAPAHTTEAHGPRFQRLFIVKDVAQGALLCLAMKARRHSRQHQAPAGNVHNPVEGLKKSAASSSAKPLPFVSLRFVMFEERAHAP